MKSSLILLCAFAVLLITVIVLEPTKTPKASITIGVKFSKGQMVDLKIGGRGQVVDIGRHSTYQIRIQTNNGPKYKWFRDFELEIVQ